MSQSSTSIPAQQLIEAGPFRANSRAHISVDSDALDLATITVRSGDFTTTIVLAGEHLEQLQKTLRKVVTAQRKAAMKVAA